MKPEDKSHALVSELMIMPDGRIFAHNLTAALAAVLGELNPSDDAIRRRAVTHVAAETKNLLPPSWDAKTSQATNEHE